jgi:hypothetical protein
MKSDTKNMIGERKTVSRRLDHRCTLWMLSQHSLDGLNFNKAKEYLFAKRFSLKAVVINNHIIQK